MRKTVDESPPPTFHPTLCVDRLTQCRCYDSHVRGHEKSLPPPPHPTLHVNRGSSKSGRTLETFQRGYWALRLTPPPPLMWGQQSRLHDRPMTPARSPGRICYRRQRRSKIFLRERPLYYRCYLVRDYHRGMHRISGDPGGSEACSADRPIAPAVATRSSLRRRQRHCSTSPRGGEVVAALLPCETTSPSRPRQIHVVIRRTTPNTKGDPHARCSSRERNERNPPMETIGR